MEKVYTKSLLDGKGRDRFVASVRIEPSHKRMNWTYPVVASS